MELLEDDDVVAVEVAAAVPPLLLLLLEEDEEEELLEAERERRDEHTLAECRRPRLPMREVKSEAANIVCNCRDGCLLFVSVMIVAPTLLAAGRASLEDLIGANGDRQEHRVAEEVS